MEPHQWALVLLGAASLVIVWSGTIAGIVIWLNTRFSDQDRQREAQFGTLPAEFEKTRHTMYGVMATSITEVKELITAAETRLTLSVSEMKSDFRETTREVKTEIKALREKADLVEGRVRQLEMLRMAAIKDNGAKT